MNWLIAPHHIEREISHFYLPIALRWLKRQVMYELLARFSGQQMHLQKL